MCVHVIDSSYIMLRKVCGLVATWPAGVVCMFFIWACVICRYAASMNVDISLILLGAVSGQEAVTDYTGSIPLRTHL